MAPTRLCNIEAVKNKGNISVNYAYDDDGILRAIRAATVAIFTATRRKWELAEYSDRLPVPRFTVRGTYRFWTTVRPIWMTPVAPRISLSPTFQGAGTLLSSGFYEIDPATGRIDVDPTLFTNHAEGFLRVRYVGGLGPSDDDSDVFAAPEDMIQACAMQAAYMYDRVVNSKVGVKQFAAKTGSTTYTQYVNGLVPEAHALIAHYIRPLTGG